MRITEIHVYQHDLPVVGGPFRMASTTVSSLDTTIVEIVTDTGIKGYGETCPVGPVYQPQHARGARAALEEMCQALIGLNPLHTELVYHTMERSLNGSLYAKAAVDTACWDIAGKAFGVRVCDLLGGPFQESVPSYYSIGVMPPEQSARTAAEKIREGFGRLQLKVGGRPLEEDVSAVRKVCEVLEPGVTLAVDANRGWTLHQAQLVSLQLRDFPFVMEQPCSTFEEIRTLTGRIPHPTFMDEAAADLSAVIQAAGNRSAAGFALKCTRVGGISPMRTIRDVCRASRIPISCDDSWGGDIIAAACVHLGATVEPELFEGTWIAQPYVGNHYDPKNGPEIKEGRIVVPEGPGLGINPAVSLWGAPVMTFG